MIVLRHEDLAAVQAQVEAAGGTITKETYSFPGGERFEFHRTPWARLGRLEGNLRLKCIRQCRQP